MTQANTVLTSPLSDRLQSTGVYKAEMHWTHYLECNGCLAKWTERSRICTEPLAVHMFEPPS